MKLVLFDCDGTLVDSGKLIHEVMIRTFVHHGFAEPEYATTKSTIGLSLDTAIARIIGQDDVDDKVRTMTQHYKDIFAPTRSEAGFHEPLFDGIGEMMAALAARELLLMGAVTGKSRRGLDLIVETHGFHNHFFVSRTADDCPSKPHPAMVLECCRESGVDPADTVVIGDAIYDMMMAKSAGAKAIGVSWGYGGVDDLRTAGANAIVYTPAEILAHV